MRLCVTHFVCKDGEVLERIMWSIKVLIGSDWFCCTSSDPDLFGHWPVVPPLQINIIAD